MKPYTRTFRKQFFVCTNTRADGRAAYEARFTTEHMLAGTLAVYSELARGHRLPAPAAREARP